MPSEKSLKTACEIRLKWVGVTGYLHSVEHLEAGIAAAIDQAVSEGREALRIENQQLREQLAIARDQAEQLAQSTSLMAGETVRRAEIADCPLIHTIRESRAQVTPAAPAGITTILHTNGFDWADTVALVMRLEGID